MDFRKDPAIRGTDGHGAADGLSAQARMRHPRRMRRFVLIACLSVASPVFAASHTVNVGPGQSYSPATLTIAVGDTVKFTNRGGLHNVKANDNSFRCARGCDGDGQGGNGAASTEIWHANVTFDVVGTVGYYCETHGTPTMGMRGTIIVQPTTPVELQSFDVD